jgi:hypothetical protein
MGRGSFILYQQLMYLSQPAFLDEFPVWQRIRRSLRYRIKDGNPAQLISS